MGIDNITVNPEVDVIEKCTFKLFKKCLRTQYIYTISDGAGNFLKLWLDKKQVKHAIIAKIKKIQYSNNDPQKIKVVLIFNWRSKERQNNLFKRLTQNILVPQQFFLRAVYRGQSQETFVFGYDWLAKKKIKETKTGLQIIKLTTNKGDFNYAY